ncbi:MAG TPA: imidazolonepropionase [Anaerolineales bacterium]|nr:imidazolonepropionase [Anaerolineales bacterium]
MRPKASLLIERIHTLVTCQPTQVDPIGRIAGACVAVAGEHILAIGSMADVISEVDASDATRIDGSGKILAPGFVDSHTHLVFGGSRVQEYAARLTRTASEAVAMGIPTGILATVEMTRAESAEVLTQSALRRLDEMLQHGTTTVESKSGYGLSLAEELKILQVNQRLDDHHPIDIISTFLGAHAAPPEIPHAEYVDLVISEMIPAVAEAGLAKFCDVYCDEGYFSLEDSRRILEAARGAGLGLKIHVDQYSDLGGGGLAAALAVVSADHLNYTGRDSARRLARAGVTGVLMPLIDFAVQHPRPFQARLLIEEGMTIALATDFCPGCWAVSMPLMIQFASRQHRLSPEEAFLAATAGGARALNLNDRGILAPGFLADIQMWDLPSFEDAFYRLGHNPVEIVIKRGKIVLDRRRDGGSTGHLYR